MTPKIFVGPMSLNVVDAVLELEEDKRRNFAFIPSRRQIEFDSGYVNNWSTKAFSKYVNGRVPLQRDHGGPGQGRYDDDGLMSFASDVENFDLIHIDPWKKYQDINDGIQKTIELIKYCHDINKNCKFEIGTEEAIRKYSADELEYIIKTVKDNIGNIFDNVEYAVVQGGTKIIGTRNVGKFDIDRCKSMISVCNHFGLKSKEHNGDYLCTKDIQKRFDIGLSAINIAPEFGVIETRCFIDEIIDNLDDKSFNEFYNLCYYSKKWVKWLPKNIETYTNDIKKYAIIKTSGHYVFAMSEFKNIKDRYPDIDLKIKKQIKNKLLSIL
tara:strand:- start:6105 stop:7079 length:975 start_codon:yes stop_codon:yes gene_type:complete